MLFTTSGAKRKMGEVWDYRLTPVYGNFFLNFQLKGFKPLTVRTIQLKVKESGELFTEKLTAYTLELESFRNKTACVCKTKVEYWLYIIANMTKMNELAFTKEQPAFKLISDIAELAKLTPEEREIYMEREKQYLSYNAVMKNERKEGILEGILRTATTMKAKGYNIEEIAECTGLTVEEIRDKIS